MEVFTIGYSGFNADSFVLALKEHNIKCLIDVRSLPYSQYHAEYNKEVLEERLRMNGIMYRNYAKEFGARQENRKFYDDEGILDFKCFIKSDEFQSGVEKVKKGIEIGYSFALMCAEKDPINCHRAIMVGQGFEKSGFSVKHIKNDGTIETQKSLEQRLLDMYFKTRGQISLFLDEIESDDVLIEKAYTLRNKDIGYHLDSGNERNENI